MSGGIQFKVEWSYDETRKWRVEAVEKFDTEGAATVLSSELNAITSRLAEAERVVAKLVEAIDIAETALVNCVPVTPYRGDGPLVRIRELRKTAAPFLPPSGEGESQ